MNDLQIFSYESKQSGKHITFTPLVTELNDKIEAAGNIRNTLLIQQRRGNPEASFLLRRLP